MTEDNIIKLSDRVREWDEAAHARGEVFRFMTYSFTPDDIGTIELDGETKVVIVSDHDKLGGLALSLDDAEALSREIMFCVNEARRER